MEKVCVDCHIPFVEVRKTYIRCPPCDLIRSTHICAHCQEEFQDRRVTRTLCPPCYAAEHTKVCHTCHTDFLDPSDQTRCSECVRGYRYRIVCPGCEAEYLTTKSSDYGRPTEVACPDCFDYCQPVEEIALVPKGGPNFYEQWVVETRFQVISESHSGYCSDAGEIESEENEITRYYSMSRNLLAADLEPGTQKIMNLVHARNLIPDPVQRCWCCGFDRWELIEARAIQAVEEPIELA